MREFRCGEIVPGCDAVFRAESDAEIIAQATEHSRTEHGIDEVPPEVVETIRASIMDV